MVDVETEVEAETGEKEAEAEAGVAKAEAGVAKAEAVNAWPVRRWCSSSRR